MEAVAIICNKNDGKLTKRILITFSLKLQALMRGPSILLIFHILFFL